MNRVLEWASAALAALLAISPRAPPALAQCGPSETQKLVASDGAAWDCFGRRVAISGDTAVVGSIWDSDAGPTSGSAYIFRHTTGGWREIAKLTAGDAAAEDYFGMCASVSGNTAIIGAPQHDGAGENSGSAYVFREIEGAWVQIAELAPDDAAPGNQFGIALALDGDTAVVRGRYGAPAGTTYVFRETGGAWRQIATLDAAAGQADDAVAISSDTVLIGSAWDGSPGSVAVFRERASRWERIATLTADDGADGDFFGVSVAISGDTAVVGACLDDDGGESSGSAYIFREIGGVWRQLAKLTSDRPARYDYFGCSVALFEGTAVIGAYLDDVGHNANRGAAYVFRREGAVWTQAATLTAVGGRFEDYFGVSVAVSGESVLVGACYDDDSAENSGAAYVFRVEACCAGDIDRDGVVDSRDCIAFLNAWAAGDPRADFDGNGVIDSGDVQAFLDAWTGGC